MPNKKEILNNPSFQCIRDISDIAHSYFKDLDLHFFGHALVKPNGDYSFLASSHDWPADILAEKNVPPMGFTIYDQITDRVSFPTMDRGDIFGWSDEVALESKHRFGIVNPMIITRKYQHHYELFIFDFFSANIYEIYTNHFKIFENFIHYHKDKTKKLVEIISQNPLKVNSQYLPLPQKSLPMLTDPINNCHFPSPRKYYLRHNDNDVGVSAKEYQCLSLLAHGKPLKEIANQLGVVLRTVETYFERLKKKLTLSTRNELTSVYWNNRILSEKFPDVFR